ncbi:copper resistance protein NlpE N-terminal domain-containing protein [Echinicola jeungdonensis]|uniref:Copper resistance protein NlpE N-terminal domain-containing protein n=1 Tax=Echinicola jeungdonensis TaxID=709343 RepID=A0ABV5J760_9BACT|nr:copper resistance protein NlpE N-terminal domain-containing protein [Echinicola jeungdonensis]MDN3669175.1 copper resistance protein NlpE N-terminal domain-containing protein [Echinicola jeungdonensis]
MKKAFYFYLLFLMVAIGCSPEKVDMPKGTFYGVLPCADCPGISYELQINPDSTYTEKVVYQERSEEILSHGGNIVFANKGILTLSDKYERESMRKFKFEGDSLIMLDNSGKEVSGRLAQYYVLHKSMPDNFSLDLVKKSTFDFRGRGNEPFWSLEIDFGKKMVFKPMEGETVMTPVSEAIRTPDTNVLRYQAETENGSLQVTIFRKKGQDTLSGEEFGHEVKVWVKTGKEEEFQEYAGCGDYLGDFRLNNLWTLESINWENLVEKSKVPYLEFELQNSRFNGFGGCNRINGDIFLEGNSIAFGKIISTKMACPNLEKEHVFLEQISEREYSFTFEGENLVMINEQDTLIFRKGMEK